MVDVITPTSLARVTHEHHCASSPSTDAAGEQTLRLGQARGDAGRAGGEWPLRRRHNGQVVSFGSVSALLRVKARGTPAQSGEAVRMMSERGAGRGAGCGQP